MLESLQYLRAVASLTVVFVHMQPPLERLGVTMPWLQSGAIGVDIFFVLSGFLMVATTTGRTRYSVDFLRRRLTRVVPFYWMITTLILVILLVSPQLVKSGRAEVWHILASYLFLPARHPVLGSIEPLLVPGWTLNYEIFYIFLWSLILVLPEARRVPAGIGVLAALMALGLVARSDNAFVVFYTSPIMLEFVFGLLLGAWYHQGPAIPRSWGWVLIVAGFIALFGQETELAHQERFWRWGIPATMVVGGALVLERARRVGRIAPFALLGDVSYSTYLTHGMVLSALGQVFPRLPVPIAWTGPAYTVLAIAATLAVAIAFNKTVEAPLARRLGGRRRRASATAAAPGGTT